MIFHPDQGKTDPKEYLLIARVVKRNCRPLTVAEVKHQQAQNVLFKLNHEIKTLQKHNRFETNVAKAQKDLKDKTTVKH